MEFDFPLTLLRSGVKTRVFYRKEGLPFGPSAGSFLKLTAGRPSLVTGSFSSVFPPFSPRRDATFHGNRMLFPGVNFFGLDGSGFLVEETYILFQCPSLPSSEAGGLP